MTALGRDAHPCLRGGDIGQVVPSFLHQGAAEISRAKNPVEAVIAKAMGKS